MTVSTNETTALKQALHEFISNSLVAAGSALSQAEAVARALTSASLRGVDSHGVRLLPHYVRVLMAGRVAGNPELRVESRTPATAVVDAADGFGHYASYRAVAEGCDLARRTGVGAVSVINSSHFGAAGCYALEAVEQGFAAFAFCNSDSFVLPHDGIEPFHGTNPISFAAPVAGRKPYFVDMATSIVPWNRVQDYRARGMAVPEDVAVDGNGYPTRDPAKVAALLPLGGMAYGYKGAALASLIEVLSAVMTGMAHCGALLPMVGEDLSTPRRLGHFLIVIDPQAFVPRADYDRGMAAYLDDLRSRGAKPGAKVMAPGDREWAEEARRRVGGIPISPALVAEYSELAARLGVDPLRLYRRD